MESGRIMGASAESGNQMLGQEQVPIYLDHPDGADLA
jgi:hypothetical protein